MYRVHTMQMWVSTHSHTYTQTHAHVICKHEPVCFLDEDLPMCAQLNVGTNNKWHVQEICSKVSNNTSCD